MIRRQLMDILKRRAREYPVVTVTGPRQSGKTTLVRAAFPDYGYVNLEDVNTRTLAERDYEAFFVRHPPPLIIDEVQRVPALVSAVQVLVDADRFAPGQFILTGSHQPLLRQTVGQSLAGRTALLRLLPLSFDEMATVKGLDRDADSLILGGGMPEIAARRLDPRPYFANYFDTYIQRDVRQLANLRDTGAFIRFVTLLAGRVGQVVNLSSLSGEVGVSHTTLASWLEVLEASFIVYRLQPYFPNIAKRFVRSPKLYFTDTGLAASLLGLETVEQVARDPLRGHLFENLVIGELLKARLNGDERPDLFFLRTQSGLEVDVIFKSASGIVPIEIKSARTFQPDFVRNLKSFCAQEKAAVDPALIYSGDEYPSREGGVRCVNFLHASRALAAHGLFVAENPSDDWTAQVRARVQKRRF